MTRSFIDLPPTLLVIASPGYFHGNGITRRSPGNQFKSPYSLQTEAVRPIDGYMQSPDFTAAIIHVPLALPDSSPQLLGFFFFIA